eukprot:3933709-Rhodomonas_salina.1
MISGLRRPTCFFRHIHVQQPGFIQKGLSSSHWVVASVRNRLPGPSRPPRSAQTDVAASRSKSLGRRPRRRPHLFAARRRRTGSRGARGACEPAGGWGLRCPGR